MKILFYAIFTGAVMLLANPVAKAQSPKEQIAKAFTDYFFLERENLHVHFDKNIFLTTEHIWFKGYAFHRKGNIPFYATTNIFASLIDQNGKIIETQLLYGSMGSFSGNFKLGDQFSTGKYYIQFYTNWMNNFTEDESAVYPVTIINNHDNATAPIGVPDPAAVTITFRAEGGTLLQGVQNSVGITVTGCGNSPLPVTTIAIEDISGKVLKTVPLTKNGYGRFSLDGTAASAYKAVAVINGKRHEQFLPARVSNGVALEINSYSAPDKVQIKLSTNKATLQSLGGKPLYVAIHQDEKAVILEMNIEKDKTEYILAVAAKDVYSGVNTIRVLDGEMNQLAERMFYKYARNGPELSLARKQNTADGDEYAGKAGPNMSLSISVLPDKSISIDESYDIFGDLLISPYLAGNEKVCGRKYLDNPTRSKHYELDLLLLNKASKYTWNTILNNPPKNNSSFDIGMSMKGKLTQKINKNATKLRIASPEAMLIETVDVNEDNEFFLNNLIVTDSTKVKFTLLHKGKASEDIKLYPQLSNNIRPYNKAYRPSASCNYIASSQEEDFEMPAFTGKVIELEEVKIKAAPRFKHAKSFGNSQLRAYKISEGDQSMFFYILDLIRYQGFDVENNGLDVNIYGRTVNTINGQRTMPMIYVDNMIVMDPVVLMNVQTADVDELYINQHAVFPSVDNKMGIIKIYMRKDYSSRAKKEADNSFLITKGFKKIMPFSNADYASTSGKGFENFGLIDWHPLITTDETGQFSFTIPRGPQEAIKVLIEGFAPDVTMISEIRTVAQ